MLLGTPMPVLSLTTINGFSVSWAGNLVPAPRRTKVRLLMTRLVFEKALARATARDWLWPDSATDQAATNLRKVLHELRDAGTWVDDAFLLDGEILRVRPGVIVTADALELPADQDHATPALPSWTQFLPGIEDPWVEAQRQVLREAVMQCLARWEREGRDERLGDALRRLIPMAPVDEALSLMKVRLAVREHRFSDARTEIERLRAAERQVLVMTPSSEYEQGVRAALASTPMSSDATNLPKLVGREDVLTTLGRHLARAQQDGPLLVWIEGEPGIGKTRVVAEFLRPLVTQKAVVVWLACREFERDIPYAVLASTARIRGEDAVDEVWRAEIARIVPEWGRPGQEPAPLSSPWRRHRFYYALSRTILGPAPTVVVVDDAQWMDRETVRWWQAVPALPTVHRTLFVVLARPPADDMMQRRLKAIGEAWMSAGRLVPLTLPPLSADAIVQLVRTVAPMSAPAVDVITTLSRGNPLRALEMARGLPDVATEPTESLNALVAWRLQRLKISARMLIERLAVLESDEMDFDRVVAIDGRDAASVLRDVAALTEVGFVQSWQSRRLRLAHAHIRFLIVSGIPPERARIHHARIAEALLAGAPRAEEHLLAARHYRAAGLERAALDQYRAAWEAGERDGPWDLALTALQEGEALTDNATERIPVLLKMTDLLMRLGRFDDGLRVADQVAELTLKRGAFATYVEAETLAARCLVRLGRRHDARRRLEQAADWSTMHGEKSGQLRLLEAVASLHYEEGNLTEAAYVSRRILSRARRWQESNWAAQALNMLGLIAADQGRYEGAIRFYARALELVDGDRDQEGVITLLGNMANGFLNLGRTLDARTLLLRRIQLCRTWGYRTLEAVAWGNLATVLITTAHFREALTAAVTALREAAQTGDRHTAAWALHEISLAAWQLGYPDAGQEAIRDALTVAESIGARSLEARFLLRRAGLAYLDRDPDAVHWAERAEQVAAEVPRPTIVARARLVRVLATSTVKPAEALEAIDQLAGHSGWQVAWDPLLTYARWRCQPSEARRRAATQQIEQAWPSRPHWSYPMLYAELTGNMTLPPLPLPEWDPSLVSPVALDDVARTMTECVATLLPVVSEPVPG
jgi:DNA-binding SARP family transcriptional activator/tetratricopeptide (TPR) repeat protein